VQHLFVLGSSNEPALVRSLRRIDDLVRNRTLLGGSLEKIEGCGTGLVHAREATLAAMEGKSVLVTGANTGIGRVTAEILARRGAHVTLACRSEEKTQPVIESIKNHGGSADFLALDLGDLASVRKAADTFLSRGKPLHVLVNNAGLAGVRGATKDGFEIAFGTNHLGHFLLTQKLLPLLRESAPARIVNVSSKSHYRASAIPFDRLRQPTTSRTGIPEYAVSKLCNVLFTKELARGRAGKGVHSYALHPGVIASEIWRTVPGVLRPIVTMFMKSVEDGAATSVWCAASDEVAAHDGRYYDDKKEKTPNPVADDETLARTLWERSEEWSRAGGSVSMATDGT
jgi:retinol dehydrogenase 12